MALGYTTTAAVQAYCTDLVVLPAGAELDRLIERCERDVDRQVAPVTRDTATGLRVKPATDLAGWQAQALSRAVGAQVAYRVTMGDEFFLEDQFASVSGPEFSTRGQRARLAPEAREELLAAGLLLPSSFTITTTPPTW